MADPTKPAKKRTGNWNWFLWWQMTPAELKEQIGKYKQLKIYQSARGLSLLLFLGSFLITIALTELMTHERLAYIDSAVFIVLGIFIYFGHRWAMILGMVLWTLEKTFQLVMGVQGSHVPNFISILIFWGLFMHPMFLAFRVEQLRRQSPELTGDVADVFD